MLVNHWMSTNVITIDAKDSMMDARKLLKEHDISMLPVMEQGKLIGIVTDRDLKQASASDATSLEIHELHYLISKLKVKEIMSNPPITIPVNYTIEEAAEILVENKISGAPVIDSQGQVVGVITKNDIFRVMMSLTGLQKRGIQFALEVPDQSGSIKEVTDIIRQHGGRMASILSSYDRVAKGYRRVYIRMHGVDRSQLPWIKEALDKRAKLLYMVDHRENRREIYHPQTTDEIEKAEGTFETPECDSSMDRVQMGSLPVWG